MQPAPLPAPDQASALDLARRVGIILAALLVLIARRCAREPRLVVVLTRLWTYLNRTAQRFERLMARLAAGISPRPRAAKPHPGGPHSKPALPTGRAWLIRILGHEAAAYASQLRFLLAEPAAADALARSCAARRHLAPICRMLGLTPPRPRRPRPRVRLQPPPPAAPRPTPPPWLRDPPPCRAGRPWWLPPRRLRSG